MIKNESCVQQHFSVYSISWIICHSNIHRRDNVAISVGCWWDVFVNHFLHTPNAASRLCTAITAAQTLLQLYLSIIRHSLTWGLISHKSEKNSWILYIHCILCSPKHWPCWWNSFIAGILLHVKYFCHKWVHVPSQQQQDEMMTCCVPSKRQQRWKAAVGSYYSW